MSAGTRLPLAEAQAVADELVGLLAESCVRFAIAGSIRRQERTCGDVELVVIPQLGRQDVFAALGYGYIRPEQRLPSSVPPRLGAVRR
jgi:hypothetical protein